MKTSIDRNIELKRWHNITIVRGCQYSLRLLYRCHNRLCVTDMTLRQAVVKKMKGLHDEQSDVCNMWRQHQWRPSSSQHVSPHKPPIPSFAMICTITSAATGSDHYQPKSALSACPPSRIADRYVQNSVCLASAAIAPLRILTATFLFSRVSKGMTINDMAARMIPGTLRSVAVRLIKVEAES